MGIDFSKTGFVWLSSGTSIINCSSFVVKLMFNLILGLGFCVLFCFFFGSFGFVLSQKGTLAE